MVNRSPLLLDRLVPTATSSSAPNREIVARPTGFNRADAISIRIPIEGAGALSVGEIA